MSIACIDPALMITELLLVVHATAEAASTAQVLLFHYIYIEKPAPCLHIRPGTDEATTPSTWLPRESMASRQARQNAPIIND